MTQYSDIDFVQKPCCAKHIAHGGRGMEQA